MTEHDPGTQGHPGMPSAAPHGRIAVGVLVTIDGGMDLWQVIGLGMKRSSYHLQQVQRPDVLDTVHRRRLRLAQAWDLPAFDSISAIVPLPEAVPGTNDEDGA
jgi:hypothetical protein